MSLEKKYKHDPALATIVVTKDKGTMVKLPNGDLLKGLITSRVTDDINDKPVAIIKFRVNLGFTETEEE